MTSRSELNLGRTRLHGAQWAGNAAENPLTLDLDAATVFPATGQLV